MGQKNSDLKLFGCWTKNSSLSLLLGYDIASLGNWYQPFLLGIYNLEYETTTLSGKVANQLSSGAASYPRRTYTSVMPLRTARNLLRNFIINKTSTLALGPTQPFIQWISAVLFLGIKRPGRKAEYSPLFIDEVHLFLIQACFISWCFIMNRAKFTSH